MSKLCLVPTPIGNIEDITLRSLNILKSCDTIFAEDTRVSQKLLSLLNIEKKCYPFHAHNEHKILEKVLSTIQANKLTVLLSDAGTPGISDPGFLLVRACIEKNITVECLPGATAFVPALVGSGMPCGSFVFEGFLPHKKGRQTKLQEIETEKRTIILYESPHRLLKLLEEMKLYFNHDRKICVVREISKLYEEYIRGTVEEVWSHFQTHEPKGELVIIIEGKAKLEKVKGNKYKKTE